MWRPPSDGNAQTVTGACPSVIHGTMAAPREPGDLHRARWEVLATTIHDTAAAAGWLSCPAAIGARSAELAEQGSRV
jgi:hypothetical protein